MKSKIAAIAIGVALVATPAEAKGPKVDRNCQKMYEMNRNHADLDHIMNYVGCDEVYSNQTLVGFTRGNTRCERRAYTGAFIRKYSGEKFNVWVGRSGCVLYEDLSWGEE